MSKILKRQKQKTKQTRTKHVKKLFKTENLKEKQ